MLLLPISMEILFSTHVDPAPVRLSALCAEKKRQERFSPRQHVNQKTVDTFLEFVDGIQGSSNEMLGCLDVISALLMKHMACLIKYTAVGEGKSCKRCR